MFVFRLSYVTDMKVFMEMVGSWIHQIDKLYIMNRTQLCRAAYKILGDWDKSEDVVQDAYMKIRENTLKTSTIKQPLAYLFQSVKNLAIDQYRRAIFESELFGLEEEGFQVADKANLPEIHTMNCQDLMLIVEAVGKLPDRTKRVFELYRIDGYTHRMIADELGISISLTNILIHEATDCCRNIILKNQTIKRIAFE